MLPIATGIIQEAYHGPDFTWNVLAGHLLSESFELLFSNTVKKFTGCFILKKRSLNTTDIMMKVPVTDGLYLINLPIKENAQPRSHAARKVALYHQRWHDKLGHVSSEQLQQMSTIYEDNTMFASVITNNFQCAPCLVSKMKKSTVDIVNPEKTLLQTEFHFDL